ELMQQTLETAVSGHANGWRNGQIAGTVVASPALKNPTGQWCRKLVHIAATAPPAAATRDGGISCIDALNASPAAKSALRKRSKEELLRRRRSIPRRGQESVVPPWG